MRSDVRRCLVAYDIPDDRRRSRLAKLLESFGDRVQFSVFVVDGSPVILQRVRIAIGEKIDPRCDSVLICDLGRVDQLDARRFSYAGQQRNITGPTDFII